MIYLHVMQKLGMGFRHRQAATRQGGVRWTSEMRNAECGVRSGPRKRLRLTRWETTNIEH